MKTNTIIAASIAGLLLAGAANATFINNGDFETGNLNGWRTSGDVNVLTADIRGSRFGAAEGMDGSFAALGFDRNNTSANRLWQNFDVSGVSKVEISFDWVFDFRDRSNNNNDVFISILRDYDGSSVNNITLDRLRTDGNRNSPDSQTLFGTYNEVIDISGFNTDRTRLQFRLSENIGGIRSWGGIDNVSVAAAPVPEPTTVLLFGVGLAGLAAVQRRKQK